MKTKKSLAVQGDKLLVNNLAGKREDVLSNEACNVTITYRGAISVGEINLN